MAFKPATVAVKKMNLDDDLPERLFEPLPPEVKKRFPSMNDWEEAQHQRWLDFKNALVRHLQDLVDNANK